MRKRRGCAEKPFVPVGVLALEPSSRFGHGRHVLDVAAHVEVGLAVGRVEDAARRAHVVVGDRADDVGQREARRRERFFGLTFTWIEGVTVPFS
jgi:hypothetical protein